MIGDRDDGEEERKSAGQQLQAKLSRSRKSSWENTDAGVEGRIEALAERYRTFLDRSKTERECVAAALERLLAAGFRDLSALLDRPEPLAPGDRVYLSNRGKSLACAVIGKAPAGQGINILGAHVDSPRIDLKANPLYEDAEFALLDTQYYGGIKNYQWTAIPLALHGVVMREDGTKLEFRLGEEAGDPVFTITDLLPHLAREQMQKKASEVVTGEDLNILAGSRPYRDARVKEKAKLFLLDILNREYGMVEEDFGRAELELVPAFPARDLGFDRSMIGGYGHDDRSCAFAALEAMLEIAAAAAGTAPDIPERTVVLILTDKEETGSSGNTGAQGRLFENFAAFLLAKSPAGEGSPGGAGLWPELALRRMLERSFMLSGDVSAALDPTWEASFDRKNASCLGRGIALTKYTGGNGKSGGSDANAEFCARVIGILNRNGIDWQYGDLGKVDKGGGGTIAKYVANLGAEVLDCGIPVLSMHAPFEVIGKIDLYSTCCAYSAFLREA